MKILEEIEKELKENYDEAYQKGSSNFFKEEVSIFGVRTPVVRKIAAKYFKDVEQLDKKELFTLCEKILSKDIYEYRTIAFDWTYKIRKRFTKDDFERFEKWIEKYVHDWAACDDFCTHSLNYFIEKFPEFIPRVKGWTRSKNLWFRRAAAVTFVLSARKGKLHNHIFEIALILLKDKEDLVQKGYGWMLKEAANADQKAVFDFVMKHKKEMPRTALRYAIEKMPKNLKDGAMKKDW